jgi:nucleoside triphosphatase
MLAHDFSPVQERGLRTRLAQCYYPWAVCLSIAQQGVVDLQLYPEATVGALVVNPKGEVLIVRSVKWSNKFTVPGGHIELGERAEDGIKREVKEETGLDVEPVKLLLIQQAIYPEDYHKHEHFIFMDYFCLTKNSEVKLDGKELQEYVWIKPEEALTLDLEEYTRKLVNKYLENERENVK